MNGEGKLNFCGSLEARPSEDVVYYISPNFHVLGCYPDEEYYDLGFFPNIYEAIEAANKHWEEGVK